MKSSNAESLFNLPEVSSQQIKEEAFSAEWLSLCHYHKKIFGGYESNVKGDGFFLSENGKINPEFELAKTIELLISESRSREIQCRFPARVKFVQNRFNINIPKVQCSELEEFLKTHKADSISYVYSSYYLNNPASIFGHTFIKFNSSKTDLLDYGVNFSATTGNEGFPLFGIKGFTGQYPGIYSVIPFYNKVSEYNNYENRDLWIYRLKVDQDQVDTFVRHVWEMLPYHYDYYFLTENCSYHGLSLLDPVYPEPALTAKTHYFVIPIDTVKILMQNNLVDAVEYRPSLRNVFLAKYNALSEDDKKKFHALTESSNNDYSGAGVTVLDTLIDYYDYKHPVGTLDILNNPEAELLFEKKKRLLAARSSYFLTDKKTVHSAQPSHPETMHDASRLSLMYGKRNFDDSSYLQPEFRLNFHDLADSGRGYPANSEIETIKVSGHTPIRDSDKKKFYFDEVNILKVTALNDFTFYKKLPSWSVYAGGRRIIDRRTDSDEGAFSWNVALTGGLSRVISFGGDPVSCPSVILFSLAGVSGSYSRGFEQNPLSIGLSALGGMKLSLIDDFVLMSTIEYVRFIPSEYTVRIDTCARYLFYNNTAVSMRYLKTESYNEISGGLMRYL
jgi:hypothetical protein